MLGAGFEQADELDQPLESESTARSRDAMRWRRRTLLATLVALTFLWILAAWVVVPTLVHDAPSDWPETARRVLIGWLALAALVWVMTSRTVARHVGTATPGALGGVRMIVCLALFGTTLGERAADVAEISAWERSGDMGVMRLLYALPLGLNALASNGVAMEVAKALTLALLLAGVVGWRTRLVLPAAAVCWFILVGIVRSHLSFTHNGLVPFYLIVLLCFTRCGDGFSVDRLLRLARGLPVVPAQARRAHYAWGRYAVWAVIVLFYVAAGVSKIRLGGWMWWDGRNIEGMLLGGAFRGQTWEAPILSMGWVPTAAFSAMGLFTLATELGMALVLLSARARLVLPAMALGMHVGIRAVQKIAFYDLMLLQVIFYDWTRIRRAVGARLRRRYGGLVVRLEARDPRSARVAALLRACDLFELLDLVLAPHASFSVMRERDGRETTGRDALAAVAARVPILWPLAGLLRVPLVGPAVFGSVAPVANRSATRPVPSDPAPPAPSRGRRPFAWPVVIPALTLLILGCCLHGVEQFPFTSMRMYARSNHSGIYTYTRMFMTTGSGDVRPVYANDFGRTSKRYAAPMFDALSDSPGARRRAIAQLQQWGAAWNREAQPAARAVALEVQKVRWDFVNHRNDPAYGRVAERLVIPLDPSRHASPATR
jgi:hypothetical protein